MTRRSNLEGDDGSVLPLIAFFCGLCLALVLTVVAVTSLYIERKRLLTLADGASLVGAESFSIDDVRHTPDGVRPRLTSAEVDAAVVQFIRDNPSSEFADLRIDRAVRVDARSATVQLSAYWSPPLLSFVVPRGFRIEVTSVARAVFS